MLAAHASNVLTINHNCCREIRGDSFAHALRPRTWFLASRVSSSSNSSKVSIPASPNTPYRYVPCFPRDIPKPLCSIRNSVQPSPDYRRDCPRQFERLPQGHSAQWFEGSGDRLNGRYHHRCNDMQVRNVLGLIRTSVPLQLMGFD